jgi:hypothetical protein
MDNSFKLKLELQLDQPNQSSQTGLFKHSLQPGRSGCEVDACVQEILGNCHVGETKTEVMINFHFNSSGKFIIIWSK